MDVPITAPVITPVEAAILTAVPLLVHAPPLGVLPSGLALPMHTVNAPVMAVGPEVTVTVVVRTQPNADV